MGCMEITSGPVCHRCGRPQDIRNEPHQLPVGYVLREQYLIGRSLGQGGFGITYMAYDLNLQTTVCIKEFYPSQAVNREYTQGATVRINTRSMETVYRASLERFLREAQALARLHNVPEIVSVHNCFRANGTAYIVMEYIPGKMLKDYVVLRGGKLSAQETLALLEPVVKALGAVHKTGLIHRDISPDNIMLHPMGGAKLLDFGAVRSFDQIDAGEPMAQATEPVVKRGFAPQEQYHARGSLGPWTDEYALCATMYYCMTGKVPPEAMARSVYGDKPDWDSIPGLTPGQKAAFEKGMSLREQDRFPSLETLHKALYETQNTEKAPDRKPEEPAFFVPPKKPEKKPYYIQLDEPPKAPEPAAETQEEPVFFVPPKKPEKKPYYIQLDEPPKAPELAVETQEEPVFFVPPRKEEKKSFYIQPAQPEAPQPQHKPEPAQVQEKTVYDAQPSGSMQSPQTDGRSPRPSKWIWLYLAPLIFSVFMVLAFGGEKAPMADLSAAESWDKALDNMASNPGSYTINEITDRNISFDFQGGDGLEQVVIPLKNLKKGHRYMVSFSFVGTPRGFFNLAGGFYDYGWCLSPVIDHSDDNGYVWTNFEYRGVTYCTQSFVAEGNTHYLLMTFANVSDFILNSFELQNIRIEEMK